MLRAQYIAYSYEDMFLSDDLERDIQVDELALRRGDILFRDDKNWKIEAIRIQKIPLGITIWIYLVGAPVN